MSRQSIRHSLLPSRLRSHSIPRPVHSARSCDTCSAAMLARAVAVELSISAAMVAVALVASESPRDEVCDEGLGWNQLLPKSKKQRSDQLQLVRKRMSSRNEQ